MSKTSLTRRGLIFGAPLALVACGAAEPVWAPQAQVDRVRYTHPGPKMITLFTMKNRGSGSGAHTGLMISASERVIFDPAGTFAGEGIIERNDVIFGITPQIEQYYVSYHSRITYYVRRMDVEVTPEVAEQALALVKSYGAVAKTQCTRAASGILSQLPGFEHVGSSLFPDNLERDFARLPGVMVSEHYEDDSDDKSVAQAEWDRRTTQQAGR